MNRFSSGFAAFVISLLSAISVVTPAAARQLSPEEALQRATVERNLVAGRASTLRLVYSGDPMSRAATPAYYVFADPSDADGGFLITTADTRLRAILGYADSGTFDPNDIPVNLAEWLGVYQTEITDYLATDPAEPVLSRAPGSDLSALYPTWTPVEPLVETAWNQGAPYNNDCPMIDDYSTLTGCVATAMAQILYYHKWTDCHGQNSYSYFLYSAKYNFEGHTFDWDNMTPTYGSESTDAQKAAVADLMYACGVAVNMNYGIGGSAAGNPSQGFITYFGYDPTTKLYDRGDYLAAEWETLIYNYLSQNGPVYYSGRYSGGHAFILDGYSENGFFHFNWGWGGGYNGYFALSALNPEGEDEFYDGYSGGQAMVLLYKPSDTNKPSAPTEEEIPTTYFKTVGYEIEDGYLNIHVTSTSLAQEKTVIYSLMAYPSDDLTDGTFIDFNDICALTFRAENTITYNVSTNPDGFLGGLNITASGLTAGVYAIRPAFRDINTGEIETEGLAPIATMTIDASGNYSFSPVHNNDIIITSEISDGDVFYNEDTPDVVFYIQTLKEVPFSSGFNVKLVDKANSAKNYQVSVLAGTVDPGDKLRVTTPLKLASQKVPVGQYSLQAWKPNGDVAFSVDIEIRQGRKPAGSIPAREEEVYIGGMQYWKVGTEETEKAFPTRFDAAYTMRIVPWLQNSSSEEVTYDVALQLFPNGSNTPAFTSTPSQQTSIPGYYYGSPFVVENMPAGLWDARFVDPNTGKVYSHTWQMLVYRSVSVGDATLGAFDEDNGLVISSVEVPAATIDLSSVSQPISIIDKQAFERDMTLESIVIPESVVEIRHNAFRLCGSLRSVKFLSMTPPLQSAAGIFYGVNEGCTFLVPRDAFDAYNAILADYGTVVAFNDFILGDADGNGTVDIQDVVITVEQVIGRNPEGIVLAAANVVDDDDTVDINDVVGIVNIVLGMSAKPEALAAEPAMISRSAATASYFVDDEGRLWIDSPVDLAAIQMDIMGGTWTGESAIRRLNRAEGETPDGMRAVAYGNAASYLPAGLYHVATLSPGATIAPGSLRLGDPYGRRIATTEPTPSALDAPTFTAPTETGRYDIFGRAVDATHKGLTIIRLSDGSVRKVIL